MKVLFIADTHDGLDLQDIKYCIGRIEPDYIFCLGDITVNDYQLLWSEYKHIPIIGILGNHDGWDLFSVLHKYNIKINDLNKRRLTLDDVVFMGLSGSLKYKDDNTRALITQDDCREIFNSAPYCDILITHDKPADDSIGFDPHGGLIGIREYIENNRPAYNIHGHLHEQYIKKIEDTNEICIYKYCLCDVNKYSEVNLRIINHVE